MWFYLGFVKMDCDQVLDLVISALAALGTIAATITALYLACRQDKVKLKVSVYKSVTIDSGRPWPESVAISIIKGSKIPFSIASGEKAPLFSIPWNEFEESLRYMNLHDDGVFRHEIQKKRIKFYVSTPRLDKNLLFNIDRKIMDAFVDSLNQKENISA